VNDYAGQTPPPSTTSTVGTRNPALHGGHGADEMHVVEPSWQPLLLAIGLTALLGGSIISPWIWIPGAVLTIVAIVNWLSELRREYQPAGLDDSAFLD